MYFKTMNLYIGDCPLKTHYLNCLDDNTAYTLEYNGDNTGVKVSVKQALISDEWDVVTLQQASSDSVQFETYLPYLEYLKEYVKKYCPHAKIYIHQTWAYEDGSDRLLKIRGYDTAESMFKDVKTAYDNAVKAIQADGIIPCGQAMINAAKMSTEKIHRDTIHASFGAGRYLLALTWYKTLTGKDISQNQLSDFDVPVSEEERQWIISAVNSVSIVSCNLSKGR